MDFTPTIHSDTYDFVNPRIQNLNGKAVFITGASKGVGRETALAYARAGASYIALGARTNMDSLVHSILSFAKESSRSPPKVLTVKLDVTDPKSAESAAKEVERAFGRLDILINNAGYLEKFKPVAESDPEDWWKVYEVNVKGPYLLTRAFLPLLLKTQEGLKTIVGVSSIGAHLVSPGASGYQSGKMALLRFAEFVQAEYGDKGVLAYCIHPGGVPTELAKNMPENMHAVLIDQPALAADTTVWLTGEKRDWLAGRYVSVTWDMKELLDKRQKIEKEDLLKVRMAVGM